MNKNTIAYSKTGKLIVPDSPIIPYIEGDGSGPDIWSATQKVVDRSVLCAYGNKRKIIWQEIYAGQKGYNKTGSWLPEDTLDQIRHYKVAIKGPLTMPDGDSMRSVSLALRQKLDLYACVRPVKYIPGAPSPMLNPEEIDMIIFRENTEDVYMGFEWEAGSDMAIKIIDMVQKEQEHQIQTDSGIGLKPISSFGSHRLVKLAIQYAIDQNKKSVTLVHKGNILKYTEGAFRDWGYQIAGETFGDWTIREDQQRIASGGNVSNGKVVIKDRIVDFMFQQILLNPAEYDVLAMPNLNGDYMSDALAAMIGGIGLAPGANIGDGIALYETSQGTEPNHAGKDKMNPAALMLSAAMMLDYLGWVEASERIRNGLAKTVSHKRVTYDLACQMAEAQELKCSEFAEEIIKNI